MVKYKMNLCDEDRKIIEKIIFEERVKERRSSILAPLGILLSIGLFFTGAYFLQTLETMRILGYLPLVLGFLVFFAVIFGRTLLRLFVDKFIDGENIYDQQEKELTFYSDGVALTSAFEDKKDPYEAFKSWGEIEHYIFLRRTESKIVLLDKNKLTEEEIEELKTYFKRINVSK